MTFSAGYDYRNRRTLGETTKCGRGGRRSRRPAAGEAGGLSHRLRGSSVAPEADGSTSINLVEPGKSTTNGKQRGGACLVIGVGRRIHSVVHQTYTEHSLGILRLIKPGGLMAEVNAAM